MGDVRDWNQIVARTFAGDADAAALLGDGLFERVSGAWVALATWLPADDLETRDLGGPWAPVFSRLAEGLNREERWAKVCYLRKLGAQACWAQEAFHLWHRPVAERYCRAFLNDDAAAADLAARISSTFIALYTEQAIATFPGYFQRMARTRAMRAAQRAPRLVPDTAIRDVAAPFEDAPDQRLIRDQELQHLRGCLALLTTRQRELLFLRFGEELTFKAIAERQGRSHQAVDQEIRRLLRKISNCMKKGPDLLESRHDQPAL